MIIEFKMLLVLYGVGFCEMFCILMGVVHKLVSWFKKRKKGKKKKAPPLVSQLPGDRWLASSYSVFNYKELDIAFLMWFGD